MGSYWWEGPERHLSACSGFRGEGGAGGGIGELEGGTLVRGYVGGGGILRGGKGAGLELGVSSLLFLPPSAEGRMFLYDSRD